MIFKTKELIIRLTGVLICYFINIDIKTLNRKNNIYAAG